MNARLLRILSFTLFFLGVLLGFGLAIITIWSRLEANHYYFKGLKYDAFTGLRCPIMIAPTQQGMVTAVFNNPTEREDSFFYRAEINGRVSTRQVEDQIMVPPRQSKSIQLGVDANDVDLMFFIFVKMNIMPTAIHSPQEAVCGIVVLDLLGLGGAQISTAALCLSFVGIASGLGLWHETNDSADQNIRRVMQALGFLVLLTMLAGSIGWWMVGIALSAVTSLLIVISVRFAID